MHIVGLAEGPAAAERRLVAAMLCFEHAAAAYGPDLERRPPPLEPWPLVPVAGAGPADAGPAAMAHYRPAVGVVFYTAGTGFRVSQLVERVQAALASLPAEHLSAPRAVAASPFAVLRRGGQALAGETVVVGPRKCYKKGPGPKRGERGLPARLLLYTPESQPELPAHYSVRAVFTWVFTPVTAALAIRGAGSMPEVNALVASVLYDAGGMSRLAEGADVYRISPEDFALPELPRFLGGGPSAAPALRLSDAARGVLVLTRDGGLAYAGRAHAVRAAQGAWRWDELPMTAWDAGPGLCQCCACDAPVGGGVVVLEPPAPAARLLLCGFCADALAEPEHLARLLGVRAMRAVLPHSQAQSCEACAGYEWLAPLLAGTARPVAGVAGAFEATARPDEGGATVVLAGEKLGAYPALTVPEIGALRLPVLAGLRLAEERLAPRRGAKQRKGPLAEL